ncbi:transcriptional regulator [Prosthecomicrobium hirschii]|uniref:Transcriptional regulator n=1 Tax=Prosthecodimorpha hirschii TaxID=665126 RepID=A0A0P6VP21_9HYPH|nr:response regulator [Prosthecomicrobium hirschii]KPL53584.1 transcriptional regulator [Prosthecomicrobium hirschii]
MRSDPRILVVDDEPQIQRFLKPALEASGFEVVQALDGRSAVKAVATAAPDAVVLDLGLPDCDGKDVIRQVRAFSQVPIVVLSARDREVEKVTALDLGADDYVSKPFGISELLARLRTALRHAARQDGQSEVISVGDLVVDTRAHRVTRAGETLRLTPKEYDLLHILARHAGRVLTHRQLLTAVWGPAHENDTQYLRVLVGQLRQKLEADPARPTLIATEPGIGYRFDD